MMSSDVETLERTVARLQSELTGSQRETKELKGRIAQVRRASVPREHVCRHCREGVNTGHLAGDWHAADGPAAVNPYVLLCAPGDFPTA